MKGSEGASAAARGTSRWMALRFEMPAAALNWPSHDCKWPHVCCREAQAVQSRQRPGLLLVGQPAAGCCENKLGLLAIVVGIKIMSIPLASDLRVT